MNVFVDANVLISVLNKEYPSFTYTSRILSLANSKHQIFTSPICLAIAFCYAEEKYKAKAVKEKIRLLCSHIAITNTGRTEVINALQNPAVLDFEDGMEYYSAIESRCTCIVTEDVADFHFASIEVLSSENFFLKYLFQK